MVIYGLIRDNGDGSANICWYKNRDFVEKLLDQDEFYQNEGSPITTITLPDGFDADAAGFDIQG